MTRDDDGPWSDSRSRWRRISSTSGCCAGCRSRPDGDQGRVSGARIPLGIRDAPERNTAKTDIKQSRPTSSSIPRGRATGSRSSTRPGTTAGTARCASFPPAADRASRAVTSDPGHYVEPVFSTRRIEASSTARFDRRHSVRRSLVVRDGPLRGAGVAEARRSSMTRSAAARRSSGARERPRLLHSTPSDDNAGCSRASSWTAAMSAPTYLTAEATAFPRLARRRWLAFTEKIQRVDHAARRDRKTIDVGPEAKTVPLNARVARCGRVHPLVGRQHDAALVARPRAVIRAR
jgi:hypothetical protein